MIELRTLGAIDLRADGDRTLHTVLAQPKRVALLIYLAVARPRDSTGATGSSHSSGPTSIKPALETRSAKRSIIFATRLARLRS
jgi:hypothetical protein